MTCCPQLESVAGWKTARVQRPVQILGSLDGILTGVRQLIRSKPLETQTIAGRGRSRCRRLPRCCGSRPSSS